MAKINNFLYKIKNAIYGKEVRGSIHDGIQAINEEVENTTERQEHLQKTFDQLIINAGENNAEIVDARSDKINNKTYKKIGDRLDNVSSQILNLVDINNTNCKFIGHRGASSIAPENTIISYQMAGKIGFWGVECDVNITQDGKWVLLHDDTLDRTTNGAGKVQEKTLEEVKKFNIDGGANANIFNLEKVPTLEEFLDVCKKNNLVPVIEVKSAGISEEHYDSFARIIKEYKMESIAVIISFSQEALRWVRKRLPGIKMQIVYSGDVTQSLINFCKEVYPCDLDGSNATEEGIKLAHKQGLRVNQWTVNNINTARLLLNWGIDYISSDWIMEVY